MRTLVALALLTVAAPGSSGAALPRPVRQVQPRPLIVVVFLRGRVVRDGPLVQLPLPYAKLDLLRAGRIVATTATDRDGRFAFTHDLPRGTYDLALEPDGYAGQLRVVVDRGVPDVVLLAHDAR